MTNDTLTQQLGKMDISKILLVNVGKVTPGFISGYKSPPQLNLFTPMYIVTSSH